MIASAVMLAGAAAARMRRIGTSAKWIGGSCFEVGRIRISQSCKCKRFWELGLCESLATRSPALGPAPQKVPWPVAWSCTDTHRKPNDRSRHFRARRRRISAGGSPPVSRRWTMISRVMRPAQVRSTSAAGPALLSWRLRSACRSGNLSVNACSARFIWFPARTCLIIDRNNFGPKRCSQIGLNAAVNSSLLSDSIQLLASTRYAYEIADSRSRHLVRRNPHSRVRSSSFLRPRVHPVLRPRPRPPISSPRGSQRRRDSHHCELN